MNPSLIEELARSLEADRTRDVARRSRPGRRSASFHRRRLPSRSVGSLFIRIGVRLGGLDSARSLPTSLGTPLAG